MARELVFDSVTFLLFLFLLFSLPLLYSFAFFLFMNEYSCLEQFFGKLDPTMHTCLVLVFSSYPSFGCKDWQIHSRQGWWNKSIHPTERSALCKVELCEGSSAIRVLLQVFIIDDALPPRPKDPNLSLGPCPSLIIFLFVFVVVVVFFLLFLFFYSSSYRLRLRLPRSLLSSWRSKENYFWEVGKLFFYSSSLFLGNFHPSILLFNL